MIGRGIAARIALAALGAAAVGLAILALGVLVIGSQTFTALMVGAGDTSEHAREMYDASVTRVVVVAVVVAFGASVLLAVWLGRRLARPLAEVGAAARRRDGSRWEITTRGSRDAARTRSPGWPIRSTRWRRAWRRRRGCAATSSPTPPTSCGRR
jgi:hypothetical protein